jgi:hypothetical protein
MGYEHAYDQPTGNADAKNHQSFAVAIVDCKAQNSLLVEDLIDRNCQLGDTTVDK